MNVRRLPGVPVRADLVAVVREIIRPGTVGWLFVITYITSPGPPPVTADFNPPAVTLGPDDDKSINVVVPP